MAGLDHDADRMAGLAEAERDQAAYEKKGLEHSSVISSHEHEPDGIHDGLQFPTADERASLRRVADKIPWNAFRARPSRLFSPRARGSLMDAFCRSYRVRRARRALLVLRLDRCLHELHPAAASERLEHRLGAARPARRARPRPAHLNGPHDVQPVLVCLVAAPLH